MKCHCGKKASPGYRQCSRCRDAKAAHYHRKVSGASHWPKKSRDYWLAVDWRRPILEIAAEAGVSRQAAHAQKLKHAL